MMNKLVQKYALVGLLLLAFMLGACGLTSDSRLQVSVLNNDSSKPGDNSAANNKPGNNGVNNTNGDNNGPGNNGNVGDGDIVPGDDCNCDSDCVGTESNPGICLQGICMQRATGVCSEAGSTSECNDGFRCWDSICFPSCDSFDCKGRCDIDNSCTFSGESTCSASCSEICLEPDPDEDFVGECGPNAYYEFEACFCLEGFVFREDGRGCDPQ